MSCFVRSCGHGVSNHLFKPFSCKDTKVIENVGALFFHIITLGIPLLIYHLVSCCITSCGKKHSSEQIKEKVVSTMKAEEDFPLEKVFEEDTLAISHQKLEKMSRWICKKLTPEKTSSGRWSEEINQEAARSRALWDNPDFQAKVSHFMENAAIEVKIYFRELKEQGNNDPKQMAELMAKQYRNEGDPIFCYHFFRDSLTCVYNWARNRKAFVMHNYILHSTSQIPLTDACQDPFFTNGTPQYHWRELYNQFCENIPEELRSALDERDRRFISWSQKDEAKVVGNDVWGSKEIPPT